MKGFFESFKNALNGLKKVFSEEPNFRLELIIALIVLLVSLKAGLNDQEMLWISLAIFLVLFTEILNSIFEYIMDFFEIHDLRIKKIKDVSAGLTLLSAIFTTIIGVSILGRKLFNWSGVFGFILYMFYIVVFLFFSFSKFKSR